MDDHEHNLLQEVRDDVRAIRAVLYGNGEVGIMGRIDRLERSAAADSRRGSRWWAVGMSFLAAVLGAAATLITAGLT